MSGRGRWQGMLAIARFNWPFYLAAGVVGAAAILGWILFSNASARILCVVALAGVVYFLAGSLGVSHWVYDRSDLYRWRWLERALGGTAPLRAIFCHAGFDECSAELRARFPAAEWTVLDHFDARTMTEPSIRRARALFPPTAGTVPAPFQSWPLDAGVADVVFGLLAIHELRSDELRTAWFREAKRCLAAEGRVVVAEHVRDAANFLAFGPGFLHFHSPAAWRRAWHSAGLAPLDEFRVTPFVRVFVLKINS